MKAKTHNKDIKAMNINLPSNNTPNSRPTLFKKPKTTEDAWRNKIKNLNIPTSVQGRSIG